MLTVVRRLRKTHNGCEGSAEVWYRAIVENSMEGNAQQLVLWHLVVCQSQ